MAEQERGQLRIYLGAAAGAGKTYDMLCEGHRRIERGADVVVAFVETHGRPHTAALLDGLEIIPRARSRTGAPRSRRWTSTPCWPASRRSPWSTSSRTPTCPGSRHAKRWEDVEELLAAGIEVISNVNIQHLESLNDVVQKITGVPQRETVPDAMVRAADQVELVDMTPEALRRRMAHGNIYPPEKIDAALTNYFRTGNLTALRELALLWLADKVDEGLQRYRAQHGIQGTWEARERVVVALTGGAGGRDADPPRGPDRRPVHRRRPARRARDPVRRADRGGPGRAGRAAAARRVAGRDLPPGGRGRHPRGPAQLRPGRERHPAGARREPPVLAVRAADRARVRRADHPRLGRHRRAYRDPRAHGPGPRAAAPLPRRPDPAPPAGRLRAGRGPLPAADPAAGQPARPAQPDQRRAGVPGRGHRGRPGRRVRARHPGRGGRVAAAQLLLHPADAQVHHRRGQQRAGAGRVRGRRADRQLGGGHRGPADPAGGPGQRRVGAAGHHGGQRAARPAGGGGRARPGPRGVRHGLGHAAGVRDMPGTAAHGPTTGWHAVAHSGEPPVARPADADVEVPVARPCRWRCAAARCPRRTAGCWARSPPTPRWRWSSSGWPPRPRRPGPSPRRTGCGPRCSPRSATTCAPRWPRPRPP